MNEAANVRSLEALADFRAALAAFKASAEDALTAVDMETRRAGSWLEEQLSFWHHQVRAGEDEVSEAKNALMQRKLFKLFDREPDCTEQEKSLRIAQGRLEEAHDKVAACRRWRPELLRAVEEYMGPARQLGHLLDAEIPQAMALIANMVAALESYLAVRPTLPAEPGPASLPEPEAATPVPKEGTPP